MTRYDYAAALAVGSVAAGAEAGRKRVIVGNRKPSREGLLGRRSSAEEHAGRGSAGRLQIALEGGQPGRLRIRGLLRPHAGLAQSENPEHQRSVLGEPDYEG